MNWHQIEQLERLRGRLTKLGYVMSPSKYSTSGDYLIGVYPLNDKLPIYSRDAELFTGTTEAIESWLRGIEHRNDYLTMLKATSDDKIKTLEEKYVKTRIHKGMLEKIKNPDKKLDKHTQDLIELSGK
jgi:hypothetical protein